jgi:type IV fimbrial biogenesis protein FimT
MFRERGFSIVELMVTVGVATILVSVAVPSFRTISMNSKQAGTVNELVAGMHLARNTAITLNARVGMCTSSNGVRCENVDWNEGWISFHDVDNDQIRDAEETILGTGSDAGGITIDSTQFPNAFSYRPNGRVMNGGLAVNTGEFALCDKRGSEHAKVVLLDMSGRPRLSEYKADGSKPSCT